MHDSEGRELPIRDPDHPYAGASEPGSDPLVTAQALDETDPIADFADQFRVPEGTLYMDGNSLGPLSAAAEATLDRALEQWKSMLVTGWTDADPSWFEFCEDLGGRMAPLLGARPAEVVVGNSITVNIHTLVGTFLDELLTGNGPNVPDRSGADGSWDRAVRPTVLVNELDFPSDHYAIRSQLRSRGLDPDEQLRVVESRDGRTIDAADIEAALAEHDDVGVVFMPTALYRSGQLFDVERITEAAHEHGAYVGFDAAHTIGAVPHEFSVLDVDFAVWCTYKYLNAGPGAPAGLYVNDRHFGLTPSLAGWWGHDKSTQFEMKMTHTPAASAGAWQIGTPPILSAAPLAGSLTVFEEAGIECVRSKSLALTDFLVALVTARLPDVDVGTPKAHDARGGHLALEHPEAYRISLALRERGVVVDFRPPNVVRLCPAPLYTRFEDVCEAVGTFESVLEDAAHERFDPRGSGVT